MNWKEKLQRFLPPVWLLVFLIPISTILLVLVFVKGWEEQIPAYFIYVLAFYTLCACVLYCVLVLPKQYRRLRQAIQANPLTNRYLTDRGFRAKVSLYTSLCVSLLYVGINLWSWYTNRSWWFVVLAAYYAILSLMRVLLVRYMRKNVIGSHLLKEWKRSRACASILLLVNLSLSGAVLMILFQNRGYNYPGIMIYIMALYTFYSTIHAVVDIIKYRKAGSPVMTTAKIVSLCAALVSMLNLETAMFAQFGQDMLPQHQRVFIILTGAGVSITVVSLSVILIVMATKKIRREHYGE